MIPEKYINIIDMPHHQSPTRPKMDRVNRAAQFSPFAALVGYDDLIDETNRTTEEMIDFGEDDKKILDEKLRIISEHEKEHPVVTVTYFTEDKRKEGGSYTTETKTVKRVDFVRRTILFTDKTELPLHSITDFSGEIIEKNIF